MKKLIAMICTAAVLAGATGIGALAADNMHKEMHKDKKMTHSKVMKSKSESKMHHEHMTNSKGRPMAGSKMMEHKHPKGKKMHGDEMKGHKHSAGMKMDHKGMKDHKKDKDKDGDKY